MVLAAVGSACDCSHEHLKGVGDGSAGGSAGGTAASAGGSAGSSAGSSAAGGAAGGGDSLPDDRQDAGGHDGGAPFELERALRECERIESCMQGPSNYDGLSFLNACISMLGQPVPDPATHLAEQRTRALHYYLPQRELIYLYWLGVPQVQTCVRREVEQGTCDALFSCFNGGAPATPCNGAMPASCQGTNLVTCQPPSHTFRFALDGGYRTFSYDCALEERICTPSTAPAGGFACAPATCSELVPHCDGDVATRCFSGLLDVETCPSGFKCALRTNPNDAVCAGAGGSCNVPATRSHCDGARQVACYFGAWATTDCAPGLSCHTAPDGVGFCGVASDCDPWAQTSRCDPTTGRLQVCALGKSTSVDCVALGFGGCIDGDVNHPAMCQ
ncbi:MAG: hypothetical protein IPJ65_28715 [Archangiaceae bacterium]|nr:hypothetical protein [Archangiaceae bacterium]